MTTAVAPELELVWAGGNSWNLLDWNDTDYGEVECSTLADGTEWGNPETVRRELRRLAFGSTLTTDRIDNRTVTLKIKLSAPEPDALAAGEGVLHRLAEQTQVELHWTAPDYGASPVAFIAVAVELKRDYPSGWDLQENRLARFFTLTLTCLPHVHTVDHSTTSALPRTTPAFTAITDWSTGWEVSVGDGTLSIDGGDVVVTGGTTSSVTIVRPGALSPVAPGAYLVVECVGDFVEVFLTRDEVGAANVLLAPLSRHGRSVVYDTSIGGTEGWRDLTIRVKSGLASISGEELLRVQGAQWSTAAAIAPPRQQQMIVSVPGSARTLGNFLIESPTTALGDVILYIGPDYPVAMSSVGITSTAGPDPATWSGYRRSLGGGVDSTAQQTYDTLNGMIPGAHVLWARVRGVGAPATLAVTAQLPHAPEVTDSITTSIEHPDSDWRLALLGSMQLPLAPAPDVSTDTRTDFTIDLTVEDPLTDLVELDEVWPFNVTDGTLIIVRAGTAQRIWVDAPSLTTAHPTVWIGSTLAPTDTRKSLGRPASLASDLLSWGTPQLTPPTMGLYVASEAQDLEISVTFRPAGLSSIPEL